MYLVLIGDLIGSRDIRQRESFQRHFQKIIAGKNERWAHLFVSPLTITLGDEIQAVFGTANDLFLMLHDLTLALSNRDTAVDVRYALGMGSIETEINRDSAIGMDGSAFHHARRGIERSKREKRQLFFAGDLNESGIINDLLNFVDITMKSWNRNRQAIVYHHRSGAPQREIQSIVGVSQSAISQNLNTDEVQAVLQSEQTLERYLTRLLEH